MGEACFPKAERARGGGRDIDDAPANERPSVDDSDDGASAVVEIEHLHPRSKRESFVGCNQSTVAWILIIRSYTQFASGRRARKSGDGHAYQNDFPHPLHHFVLTFTSFVWSAYEA